MFRGLLGCGAALLGTAWAQTQEEIERFSKMTTFAVGGAVAIIDEPYRELDPNVRVLPIPFYIFNKGNLTLAGPNVSYRFWKPTKTTTVSFEGRYRFQGYDADDSPFLQGMDDRNGTLELGARAVHRIGRLRLQFEGMTDVAGQHDGFAAEARATFEVSNFRAYSLRPLGGIRIRSSNFVDYYFGVENDEVRLDRGFFEGDTAYIPFVGANFRGRISRRIQMNGSVTMDFLPSEITDSPIVGDDYRVGAFIGLSYMFAGPGVSG
ncbi:MAG: MipA/OmpV family protein [Pseudomonadota bacterium]